MSPARFLEAGPEWDARWAPAVDTHPSAPLPAGVSPTEGRLQEWLLAAGHPCPLSEAARVVAAGGAASGTDRRVPAAQWSAGIPVTPASAAERETRFRHTETREAS